jgi:dTDP-glucose 4,6-dehydratase
MGGITRKKTVYYGGTGFGCWLWKFCWANEKLGLNASILILTRNLEAFKKKAPTTAHPS